MFLYLESRETMMHVAGLLTFTPPPDTPPDHLRHLVDEMRAAPVVHRPWSQKLRTPDLLVNPLQAWVDDRHLDLDYHVRRTALPSPGDERELGIVVSRLHGNAIDFHRPPWELHLIEGLEGGRFALYVKVHHALVDGYSAMRILAQSLSRDPGDRSRPLFFGIEPSRRAPSSEPAGIHFPELIAAVRAQLGTSRSVAGALVNMARARLRKSELVSPLQAPRSMFNRRISRSRRFATQKVETARLKAVAKAAGGTLNDVVLALSAASLRRYLVELDALPADPLVAMVPVNVRPKDDSGGGNAVGALLASLATNVVDPAERLAAIIASTRLAKEQLQGMSKAAIIQYSALSDVAVHDAASAGRAGARAAGVQRGHLECAGAGGDAVFPRRAAGGGVSDVDTGARAGAQHHVQQLCGELGLRVYRVPGYGAAFAEAGGVLRGGVGGVGGGVGDWVRAAGVGRGGGGGDVWRGCGRGEAEVKPR